MMFKKENFILWWQQLVRKERQALAEKRRLSKYVATLRTENQRLLIEIGHCRNNVDNLRKMIVSQDDDPHKDYLHYVQQRSLTFLTNPTIDWFVLSIIPY